MTQNTHSFIQVISALSLIVLILIGCTQQKAPEEQIPVLESGSLKPMPAQWIDKDTQHKIIRLGNQDTTSKSFYFHNDPFVVGADALECKMVYFSKIDGLNQLFVYDFKSQKRKQLTFAKRRIRGEIVSDALREAFYQSKDSVFAVNIDSGKERLVYVFPEDFKGGISCINSDGTLLAGTYAEPLKDSIYKANPNKSSYFDLIYDAHIPHIIFTIDLATQKLNKIHHESAWLNHLQFSPTDPYLLSYCHEGPWHKVDRMWTMDVRTGQNKKMHERTMDMEIAGHEFFSQDGQRVWYDLQMPKSKVFYLASVDFSGQNPIRYQIQPEQWSIHFNISPDQKTFVGDGGDSTQVAHSKQGQWIYHFTPQSDTLISERLVNTKYHHYRPLEPNVHFTPDGKWVVFRSDMDGDTNIYAVELEKSYL